MSSNIGQLVDRVFREYLEPNDDIQSFSVLRGDMAADASVVTLNYDANYLTSEEEDALEPGAVVEVNRELMLVTALSTTAQQLTVERAFRSTTLAAHTTKDVMRLNPVFPRNTVFNAVVDQISNLYPTLYATETKSISSKTGYIILDGTNDNHFIAPIKAISQNTDFSSGADETGIVYQGVAVEMVDLPNPFTYTDPNGASQTVTYTKGPNKVNAIQVYNVSSGHTVHVIIMAGVAAQLISGRDIPSATVENVTQSMQSQGFPVNSASTIRNSLLQYQRVLLEQARKDLRARFPEPVTINKISYT